MTARRAVDRVIATWLTEIAPEGNVDYLDETLGAIDRVRQRPVWASPGRWLPMQLTVPRVVVPRAAPYLAILALLLIGVIVALAVAGGQKRLPAPFGLAATGLVAFESEGDILVANADGSSRRPLIATPGAQWSQVFSRRGDRIAYWSAAKLGDPASLFVAEADGSNARLMTREQTFVVGDGLPAVNWSPDDRRLAFSSDPGDLYVVNADGTDLHRIVGLTHQRLGPVWSPDGTLIAYTGQPLNDPYSQTSSWVIAPDGTGEKEVIPSEGGWEIANVNPSWSPDGRSLLVHTGVAFEGEDTDIYIAERDAAGVWSRRVMVGGPTWDYHPSWSNAGTQFSFIRAVEGSNPDEKYVLMVADADGSHVHPVSPVEIGFAAQCWSPDDRFIRTTSIRQSADRTILLIPLDGTPFVEIPAPGEASKGTCQMQRLAP
jgi:Tol biopolymer transport system component